MTGWRRTFDEWLQACGLAFESVAVNGGPSVMGAGKAARRARTDWNSKRRVVIEQAGVVVEAVWLQAEMALTSDRLKSMMRLSAVERRGVADSKALSQSFLYRIVQGQQVRPICSRMPLLYSLRLRESKLLDRLTRVAQSAWAGLQSCRSASAQP